VSVFSYQKAKNDRQKTLDACRAFACEPWIAIYVECTVRTDLFLLSLEHYDQEYRGKANRAIDDWKMGEKHKRVYENDPDVKHVLMEFSRSSWNWA
jgi:hypothetical protein